MSLEPGVLLSDRYRIERVLGRGGFGAVYLAADERLGVACAIKENINFSPETERQFKREGMLLAGLRHPNLPRVTNHFILGGQQYLVMDYVEGEDLRQRLAREKELPQADVLKWAAQICDALTYLHSRTPPIIHRDIKPANIKLTASGEAMLVDFGIAKAGGVGQQTTTSAMGLTPGFAPPEQYGTGGTDARTDEYALAATLYNLLTGRTPPDSMERLLGNVALAPVDQLRPGIAPHVAAAIMRALEIQPDQRFPGLAEFGAALSGKEPLPQAPESGLRPEIATMSPATVAAAAAMPVAASARRLGWPALVGGGGLLTVLALLLALGLPQLHLFAPAAPTPTLSPMPTVSALPSLTLTSTLAPPPPPPTQTLTPVPTATPPPTETPTATFTPLPTATPTLALIVPANANRLSLQGLWGRGRLLSAQWSPDNKYLGVDTTRGAAFLEAQTLKPLGTVPGAQLLSAGQSPRALVRGDDGLRLVSVSSGETLQKLRASEAEVAALSPDGNRVALGGQVADGSKLAGVALLDVATDNLRLLPEGQGLYQRISQLLFTPDSGKLLALTDGMMVVWEVETGKLLRLGRMGTALQAHLSPDGKLLAYFDGSKNLVVENLISGTLYRSIPANGEPYFGHGTSAFGYEPLALDFAADSQFLVAFYQRTFFDTAHGLRTPVTVMRWPVMGGPPEILVQELPGVDWGATTYNAVGPWWKNMEARFGLNLTGDRFYSLNPRDGMARIWDYPACQALAASAPYNVVQSAGWRADGAVLAIPDALGVNVLDLVSGQTVKELRVFINAIDISEVAYAGETLLTLRTNSVERWDPASGNMLKRYAAQGAGLVVSPDEKWFALRDKYIKVYDMETGQQRHSLGPNLGAYVFTPDSNFLVTASGQMATFWDLRAAQSGAGARTLASHGPAVGGLAFTPDGTRLVSSTGDLWDVASGKVLAKFSSKAAQAAISPDGRLIVGSDGSLWDADSGQPVGQLSGARGPAVRLAFTPDGRRLVWETEDGVVEVWGVNP